MPSGIKFDAVDAKILKTLLRDARTSFTEMARNCKITVGAVRMRYKRLWKAGIINGEIMEVNPHALGFEYVVDLGLITCIEDEKEVTEFLKNKRYKYMNVVGPFGRYNVWAVAVFNNLRELTETIQDLESHPCVKRVESLIWTEVSYVEHVENLIFEPFGTNDDRKIYQRLNEAGKKAAMDQTDIQIAKTLSLNARIPFKRIAEQLGISTKNVIQRYKKLKGHVLTTSTITVDLKKLGFQAFAFLFIKVANRSKLTEIHSQLIEIPNMVVAIRTLGSYDINATAFITNFEKMFEITERIRRIPGIDVAETYLCPVWDKWPPDLFSSLL